MAVVSMQKVRVLVHKNDVDVALDLIQRTGALEFKRNETTEIEQAMLVFPQAELLPRVDHAIRFLEPYGAPVSGWKALREGVDRTLTEKEIAHYLQDTDVIQSIVSDLEALQVDFADTNETVRVLEEKYAQLIDWQALPIKLSDFETSRTVTFLLKYNQASEKTPFAATLENYCTAQQISYVLTEVSPKAVALTLRRSDTVHLTVRQVVDALGAELVTLPSGIETPHVEFVAVSEQLAKAKGEVALLHDQAEHFAITHLRRLREASEIYHWQHDRYAVMTDAAATRFTIALEGWLMTEKLTAIQESFKAHALAAIVVEQEPAAGEEPPVEIRNGVLAQPFEVVTRLYGMPGYRDLDPTAFLAGFFMLSFGFALTDVGYGLVLVLAGSFVVFFLKAADKGLRLFAKLMIFLGVGTMVLGALFGGYFGFDMSTMPPLLQKMQLFDPIKNPIPVFLFALAIGVFQVMVGMALKIYSEAKQGRLIAGIIDRGPWLFTFTVGVTYLLTMAGVITTINESVLSKMAYLGAALIVLAGFAAEGGIFKKVTTGFANLYEGVGYFSDILSYSRLLALGLSTTALAFAINLIAELVHGLPYVGFIAWLVVLFIGHVFTLVVNTLGAFVHGARLQFVEYFGKFISGTGKEFSPLSRKHRFVTISDD